MCKGCWIELGSPEIDDARTRMMAELIARVYEYSTVGSNLHIVLDDWNLEDDHVQWCLDESIKKNTHECSLSQLSLETTITRGLLKMTIAERASALAMHDEFFGERS